MVAAAEVGAAGEVAVVDLFPHLLRPREAEEPEQEASDPLRRNLSLKLNRKSAP